MKKLSAALLALPLLLSGAAFAETDAAKPAAHAGMDFAAWHKDMCADHYAHTFGKLAYLRAKLDITDAEAPFWDKWQKAETDAAAKEKDSCLQDEPPARDGKAISMLDQEEHMEKMLSTKLDELRSARPALEALYTNLTADQKKIFDEVGEWHHHGPHGMEGGNGPEHGEHDMPKPDGDR